MTVLSTFNFVFDTELAAIWKYLPIVKVTVGAFNLFNYLLIINGSSFSDCFRNDSRCIHHNMKKAVGSESFKRYLNIYIFFDVLFLFLLRLVYTCPSSIVSLN